MAWYRRLTNLLRSDRHSRDLDREMGFHLAERVDELIAAGMPEAEARREARRRFGNRGVMKERTRDADILAWLDALLADLRQAARALRSNPGFAFVAVLSLGARHRRQHGDLLAHQHRHAQVPARASSRDAAQGDDGEGRRRVLHQSDLGSSCAVIPRLYAGAFAYNQGRFDLAQGGEVRSVDGEWVSGDYFATLGVPAMLGRTIAREDDVRGCPAIAVLSWGLWQNEFGGARSAIGKTLMVNSHPFTIVGVVDRAFFGMEVGRQTQIYAPICAAPTNGGIPTALEERALWWLNIVVRSPAGATAAQTGARLAALAPAVFAATVPPQWHARRSGGLPQAHADGGARGERLLGPAPGVRRRASRPDGRGGTRAAHRVRQRREPAAGARHGATA